MKIERVYIFWHELIIAYPKIHRYSLATKIDNLFVELIGDISFAYYTNKENKILYINKCIRGLDTIKILLNISRQCECIENKKYIQISEYLNEIGKILGGWLSKVKSEIDKTKTLA